MCLVNPPIAVQEKFPTLTFSGAVAGDRGNEGIFLWAIRQRIQLALDGEQVLVTERL